MQEQAREQGGNKSDNDAQFYVFSARDYDHGEMDPPPEYKPASIADFTVSAALLERLRDTTGANYNAQPSLYTMSRPHA